MKIYYHNDADGRCAAAIVLQANGYPDRPNEAELIEKAYNKKFDYDAIYCDEEIWLVDLAITPEELIKIHERTDNVKWFDHHKSTAEKKYIEWDCLVRVFDLGKCGAMLVWDYCFPDNPYPYALELIDDYDRWVFKYGGATNDFRFGLETKDHSPEKLLWVALLAENDMDRVEQIRQRGDAAISYRDTIMSELRKNYGFKSELAGIKCFCMNFYGIGSRAFGNKIKEYDLCVGFVFDGEKYTYGLYSEKIDVSVIAKTRGGGGHPGASGFTTKEYLL